jgi:hypothetical protein
MNTRIYPFKFKDYRTKADRLTCPGCGRHHSLVPYVDVATGNDLPERFGRCNRVDSCGYHEKPSTKDLNRTEQEWEVILKDLAARPAKPNVIVDLPADLLIDTLKWNEENSLFKYLINLLPMEVIKKLFKEYLIGNHTVWDGAVIFWFVNKDGGIRAGQVKQFDLSGHTVKNVDKTGKIRPRTIWIHSLITEASDWLQSYLDQKLRCDCLFGEHLMNKYPDKPIAIFESPKTAILAAAYFPDFLCMAIGALDYFTYERVKVLKGRKVILYPDLSKDGKTFTSWSEKANRFKDITDFKVSTILEDKANDEEKALGLDMADFLERFDFMSSVPEKVDYQLLNQKGEQTQLYTNSGEKSPTPEVAKSGESDNQALIPNVKRSEGVANRDTPDQVDIADNEEFEKPIDEVPALTVFDSEEYRTWFHLAQVPKRFIMNPGRKNEYILYDTEAFVTGRLNGIGAYMSAKGPDKNELLARRSKFIRELNYIRKKVNAA